MDRTAISDSIINRFNGKRVVYTLCFLILCVIDQRRGSAVGEVQMIFANCTGFVMAVIILSAYHWRDFMKAPYFIWFITSLVIAPIAIYWGKSGYDYWGQWNTGVLNIVVYGLIVIRIIYKVFLEKKRIVLNKPLFILWVIMMIFLLISKNEAIWPIWFLVMFGCFYLTEFSQEDKECLYNGMMNGLIIGFFIIQGLAFVFRPYDYIRYKGMYAGETQNGLFYLMTFTAFLCKWRSLRERENKKIWQYGCFAMSGILIGFTLYTGGRSAIIGEAVVTLVIFVLDTWKQKERKKYQVINRCVVLLLCIVISIPVIYVGIRYIPPIFHHPIWYQGEYGENKVKSYDSWDSEYYVDFKDAVNFIGGRVGKGIFGSVKNVIDSIFPSLQVNAAEIQPIVKKTDIPASVIGKTPERALFDSLESAGTSVNERFAIWHYYLERLNIMGHKTEELGFWYIPDGYITHTHNIFVQMLFQYGILPGGIFILFSIMLLLYGCKILWSWLKSSNSIHEMAAICMIVAFFTFGFFEANWVIGNLSFTTFFIAIQIIIQTERKKRTNE